MRIVRAALKWMVRAVAALGCAILLALLLWPVPSIRQVRLANPEVLTADAMLVFTNEFGDAYLSARLLMTDDNGRRMSRHLRHIALTFRLALFTTERQRAAFVARSSYYGFGVQDFPAFTQGCFGKLPEDLDLAEAAELAVRSRRPSHYMGGGGAERLVEDRDKLLRSLSGSERVNAEALALALSQPVGTCHR